MPMRFDVYDKDGRLIFSASQGVARILGRMEVTGNGSRTFNAVNGESVNSLFAFTSPFIAPREDNGQPRFALWCVGNTMYWAGMDGRNVVYGDAFA